MTQQQMTQQQADEFRYQLDHLQGVWDDGHSTAEQTLFLIADVLITIAESQGDARVTPALDELWVKRMEGG